VATPDAVGAEGAGAEERRAVPRLINRLRPAPLESLGSLLQRLGEANHYREWAWLGGLLGRHPARPEVLRRARDFQTLGELTGLDQEELIGLTLHRFAPWYGVAQGPPRPALPAVVSIPLWPAGGSQGNTREVPGVCPACWEERPVILVPWWLHHLTACPRHLRLLHQWCSRCNAPLRLVAGHEGCGRCGQAVAGAPTRSIAADPDSVELTGLLWCATGCTEGPYPPEELRLAAGHPLRRLGTPARLRGLWRCAQAIVVREGASHLQALTIADLHAALVAAWRLLRDGASWWGAGVPFPIVLSDEAEAGERAWIMAGEGWLRVVGERAAEGYRWGHLTRPAFPAVSCLWHAECWDREDLWLRMREAAAYCQVGVRDLEALAGTGLIRPVCGPLTGDAAGRWLFSERTLRRSLEALLGALPVQTRDDVGVASGDVAWALTQGSGRITLVELLRAVRAGMVPAFRARPTVQVCDVWVERAATAAYLRSGNER